MPKYSSYPVITEIVADDVVLIHQDSSNAEKLISFENIIASIVTASYVPNDPTPDAIVVRNEFGDAFFHSVWMIDDPTGTPPVLRMTDQSSGLIEVEWIDLYNLANATHIDVPGTIVMRPHLGATSVFSLMLGGTDTLVAADIATIHAATSINLANTLVKRDPTTSGISVGQVTVTATSGGSGQVNAASTISSSTDVIAPIGTFTNLTASNQLQVGSTVGLRVGPSETNGRIKNWHWHPISQVFAGGAPTETFDVNIAGSGFSSKPDIGFLMAYNPDYIATYQISSGSSTSTNARCELIKRDGTNIVGGTFAIAGLFIDL